ncbi:hypothetical protein SAY86_028823 [Trapa natans]|uniref:Uncharacterized protein n=1 Tax=Trapa natans TaxID=22666 RepID=A0AAN7M217_TRANT|nr:hypothetical protein SAY86_028823 [Trapa natans]
MLFAPKNWIFLLKQCPATRLGYYYCSKSYNGSKTENSASIPQNGGENSSSLSNYGETYNKLHNLDFTTAADILFAEPVKKKRFGFDFHLVQFFFACMPSLAVYLVAQYARYEMRIMEAEQEEKKKKQEQEEKAKTMELEAAAEQAEASKKREIEEVKERLDKLEESIREVSAQAKGKSSISTHGKIDTSAGRDGKKLPEDGSSSKGLESRNSAERSHITREQKDPSSSQKV